jgi:nucleoside-diphosphate-sugar epimerase
MKCLVTGSTGFIGRSLCGRLEAEGMPFIPLSNRGGLLPSGRVTTPLNLASQPVDSALLAGVDVVFHLAGIAHQRAETALYDQLNRRATVKLAAAAAAAGAKLFIFVSSVKAMGLPEGDEYRTELDCSLPEDDYGMSKRDAELDLQSAYAEHAMSVLILRPALVYGAGASGNLALLAQAVRVGVPRPPELGGRSMIALEDFTGLLCYLARRSPAGFHIWTVCDGRSYSARELHDLMRIALGRVPARSWLPTWAWRAGCVVRDVLTNSTNGSTFSKIFGTELYSGAALLEALDWRPEIQFSGSVNAIMALEPRTGIQPGEDIL